MIKIAVTWTCGHTDEYNAPSDFEIPKSWKFKYDEQPDAPEVYQHSMSEKQRKELR